MSEKAKDDVVALAQEAMIRSLAVPHTVEHPAPTCVPGDKECIERWVSAFADCDQ